MVGRVLWGWVSDAVFGGDRGAPLVAMCSVLAVGSIGLALLRPGDLVLLFGSAILVGLSGLAWNGVVVTALAEIGGLRSAGSTIGLGLMIVSLAGVVAPFLFGALADAHGFAVAWVAIAFVGLLGIIPAMLARALAKRHAVPSSLSSSEDHAR